MKWKTALARFDQDHDPETFGTAFGELNVLILRGARAHIGRVQMTQSGEVLFVRYS